MSTLRWILLIAGIIVVASIYFFGRSKQSANNPRQEPALDQPEEDSEELTELSDDWDHDLIDFDKLIADGLQSEVADYKASNSSFKAPIEEPPAPAPTGAQPVKQDASSMLLDDELVVLHLLARQGKPFDGETLYSAFSSAGFKKSDNNIFSCQGNEGSYLAVNALKPGTFPEEAAELETKAIGLILRLSQTKQPLAAFDELLLCARFLQDKLDARLSDGQRSSLTLQTIHYLEEEIKVYQHKHRK